MRVLVPLSGGKGSLIAAWLLKKQGMQVRGVFFDVLGKEDVRDRLTGIERRLGIQIQYVNASVPFSNLLENVRREALQNGVEFDAKREFQIRYLIPELIRMRKESGYDRIASGHRAALQEDLAQNLVRVIGGADADASVVGSLLAIPQSELSHWIAPVGSIPKSMLEKLGQEVSPEGVDAGVEVDWISLNQEFRNSARESYREFQVYSTSGALIDADARSISVLKIGEQFQDPSNPEIRYAIVDIQVSANRILVEKLADLQVSEVHFQDGHWFTSTGLGLTALDTSMVWRGKDRSHPVRLIEFEGNRLKGVLDPALRGTEADLFKGDEVLWVQGPEILGGARVMKVK